jgi:prepilin peptidase CpaA
MRALLREGDLRRTGMIWESNTQAILFVAAVGLFTAAAAVWDLRSRRIPNKLTVPVFVLGLAYQAAFAGWSGLGDAAAAFGVGFGTLFVLWLVGGGGGGDVKMMGALSVWLGFHLTLLVMIVSTAFVFLGTLGAVVCGVVSGVMLGSRRGTRAQVVAMDQAAALIGPSAAGPTNAKCKRRVMAYALPVALATWLVVIWKLPVMF